MREIVSPIPVRLFQNETMADALDRLRGGTVGERIVYFYVTDDSEKLVGVVPTRHYSFPIRQRWLAKSWCIRSSP